MFYLLKFTYYSDGRGIDTIIILNEEQYNIFCQHNGQDKNFTYRYSKCIDDIGLTCKASCKFQAAQKLGDDLSYEVYNFINDEDLYDEVNHWIDTRDIKFHLVKYIKRCERCFIDRCTSSQLPSRAQYEISIFLSAKDMYVFIRSQGRRYKIPDPELCPRHLRAMNWVYTESEDIREDLEDVHFQEHVVTSRLRNEYLINPLMRKE